LPSLPAWVGAPLAMFVFALGVAVGCSILTALEGGEGSMEFLRSWAAACCGLTDVARGGGLDSRSDWSIGWTYMRLGVLTPTLLLRLLVAQL
jgi:hypothetical protein